MTKAQAFAIQAAGAIAVLALCAAARADDSSDQTRRQKMIGYRANISCQLRAGNISQDRAMDLVAYRFDKRDIDFFNRADVAAVTQDLSSFLLINGTHDCQPRQNSDIMHFIPRIQRLFN